LTRLLEQVNCYRAEQLAALAQGQALPFKPILEACAKFVDTIDVAHQRELLRFSDRTFHIYNALRRCPGLFDLLSEHGDTPELAGGAALGFALANVVMFRERKLSRPLRTARSLVKRKRRDIAAWLGFPRDHAAMAVRVLGRIPSRELCNSVLHNLRTALCRGDAPTLKLLAHGDRINVAASLLFTHANVAACITPSLLHDVSSRTTYPGGPHALAALVHDTFGMMERRGVRMPRLDSLAALQALHDTEVEAAHRAHLAFQQDVPYLSTFAIEQELPAAPVRELPTQIEYVSHNTRALDAEGSEMRNCVGGYFRVVARGECFIYRVLQPERCTLAIALRTDNRFHIRELRGRFNKEITGGPTIEFIKRWLKDNHDPDAVVRVRELLGRETAFLQPPDAWQVRQFEPGDELPF
jgi:hypothetical protein